MKRNTKLFLTGGTGFFGKNILEYLSRMENAPELTILTRNPERFIANHPGFRSLAPRFLKGDIRNFEIPEEPFDFILHGAASADAKLIQERPDETLDVIVGGTRRVLELAKRNPSVRMLFLSSGAVCGTQPDDLPFLPETRQGSPVNAYGIGKKEAEQLCLNSEADCTIARCFSFSGRHLPLNLHYALGNFIGDVKHDRDIQIHGDGRTIRSYLDSSDLCEWLFRLLFSGTRGMVCNVGSDRAITLLELAELILQISGSLRSIRVGKAGNGIPVTRYVPDLSRASAFGLKQTVPLEESIRKMLDKE